MQPHQATDLEKAVADELALHISDLADGASDYPEEARVVNYDGDPVGGEEYADTEAGEPSGFVIVLASGKRVRVLVIEEN